MAGSRWRRAAHDRGWWAWAWAWLAWLLLPLGLAIADPTPPPTTTEALARGDAAWSARASRLDESGLLADPDRIEEAIEHYARAVSGAPDSLEARWKLLRALHYAIDFAARSEAEREASAATAIEVAKASVDRLDEVEGASFDRARVYFWSSIAWGTRASRVGLLTIVREGVARRMHDYAERSLALDETVDQGGALRLLARLHATLPRVPFVSGWVDRDQAMPYAERAVALDPSHPGSRLVLALTRLDLHPEREAESRADLARVADMTPREDFLVEDLAIREQARERLAELTGEVDGG